MISKIFTCSKHNFTIPRRRVGWLCGTLHHRIFKLKDKLCYLQHNCVGDTISIINKNLRLNLQCDNECLVRLNLQCDNECLGLQFEPCGEKGKFWYMDKLWDIIWGLLFPILMTILISPTHTGEPLGVYFLFLENWLCFGRTALWLDCYKNSYWQQFVADHKLFTDALPSASNKFVHFKWFFFKCPLQFDLVIV